MPINIYDEISAIQKGSEKAALCVVVRAKGSSPRKAGAKMIVYEDGRVVGSIGGGNLEKKVIENALIQLACNTPKLFKHDLLQAHNMCCGGVMDVYIEPIVKTNQLFIFGAGHTGAALASIAEKLAFSITIIDDRQEYLAALQQNDCTCMPGHYEDILPQLPFDPHTFIVIMTYDHAFDRAILSYCLQQPFAYLGMIGSKRKITLTKKMFLEGGMATQSDLDKVDMPMGIDIHAETPGEIAISILAKIIAVKNQFDHKKRSNE